jgi:4-amino-4-deoxy-L-arabinose transferase-like glycosyltransferase
VGEAVVRRAVRLSGARPFALTLALVGGLTLLRIAVLFATPLELYPDEAQYWAWSRDLAFGYFSKPPMIAWLIRATTAIGGDAEPWVRLSAPLLHAGAAVALLRAGAKLYDDWTGFLAAALYSLMPGVQLSAGVVATDAPLLCFLSLTLVAYAEFLDAETRRQRLRWAAAMGAALGLAFLSKYAALYFLVGLAIHAALSAEPRRIWRWPEALVAFAAFLLLIAPNLAWNAEHGFATVGHVMANTDWTPPADVPRQVEPLISFDLRQTPGFVASQFVVFGPIPFAVLIGGTALLARRRALEEPDKLLLSLIAPPLLVVLVQAIVARANANWAGAAYAPASVLVAAWLIRYRARRWTEAAIAVQATAAGLFLILAVSPVLADRVGLSNSFKRARGWAATTEAVLGRARAEPGLTAIAMDDRFLFNAMQYYGRDELARPGAPPIRMWMRRPWANTQAEIIAPLRAGESRRVLVASLEDVYLDEMLGDFARTSPVKAVEIPLDPGRRRRVSMFVGQDLRPQPRDPETGLPIRSVSSTTARVAGGGS